MTLQVARRTFHDRRSTQIKVKGIFLVPSTGSSVFLQETSCRTFGRAKSNFKSESNGGNLLIRPTSTCVSIPCLHPSFFHLLVLLIVLLQELPVEIVGN